MKTLILLIIMTLATGAFAGFQDSVVIEELPSNERIKKYNELSIHSKDPDDAIAYGLKAYELAKSSNDQKGIATALTNIAFGYYYKNDFYKATEYLTQCLELQQEIDDQQDLVKTYNNLGIMCQKVGDFETAVDYYQKSLELKLKIGDELGAAKSYSNLATIFQKQDKYLSALELNNKALGIYEKLNDSIGLGSAYNNLGIVYDGLDSLDKSLEFYNKALKIKSAINDLAGKASTLNNIGLIYKAKKKYDESLEYLSEALQIRIEINDLFGASSSYNNLGEYFLERSGKDVAIDYFEKSVEISKRIGAKEHEMRACKNLSEIYSSKGQFEKAYDCQVRYGSLKDSIYKYESNQRFTELMAKFKYNEEKREKALVKKDEKIKEFQVQTHSNLLNIIVLIILLVVLFAVFLIIYKLYRNKILETYDLESQNQELDRKVQERTQLLESEIIKKTIARQDLEDNYEFVKTLIETIPNPIFYKNKQGEYIGCNKAFEDLIGLTEDQIRGKTLIQISSEKKADKYHQHDIKLILEGKTDKVEENIIHSNGQIKETIIYKSAFKKKGEYAGLVGIIFDISDRKKLEDNLKSAKSTAEEATKTKSMYLASMSHEIRTPLSSIIGLVELLKDTELDQQQAELLKIINTSSNILLGIINQVLDFSKIEAGQVELDHSVFNPIQKIEEVTEILKVRAEKKGLEFSFEATEDFPELVVGDHGRFKQILMNLASNAVKFTKKGSVKIYAENLETTNNKVKLKITVKDTGVGISSNELDKLFRPFSQLNNRIQQGEKGTGLGLAISKHLSNRMGGDIFANSIEGEGSTFWFTVVMDEAIQQKTESKDTEQITHIDIEKLVVLVAEDDPINVKLISFVLTKKKFNFDIARNGKEAIDMYKSKHYDLILMDVNMPVIDGMQASREIRLIEKELYKDLNPTRIIAVTAKAVFGDEQECLDSGMDGYISKPFKPNELIDKINLIF